MTDQPKQDIYQDQANDHQSKASAVPRAMTWLQQRPILMVLLIGLLFLLGAGFFWLTPKLGLLAGLCWASVGILVAMLLSPTSPSAPVHPASKHEHFNKESEDHMASQPLFDLTNHLNLLDSELEQLHDQNWELREAELKYNALLNRQGDIIIHQGDDGTIHFANAAFDEWFDRKDNHLPFTLDEDSLVATSNEWGQETNTPSSPSKEARARSDIRQFSQNLIADTPLHEKLIETRQGPRWFRWTETLMRSAQRKETLRLIIARDITAYKRVEAASEAKSRFLATISHEMRTPLNGVIGMANLLEQTSLNPEQTSYVQALRQSGSSLLSLVNDVLDLSRVEAGKLALKEDWVAPFQIVEEVTELLAPNAQSKGLSIASWMAPDLPEKVLLDPVRVRQILINLLGNAIKFTDAGAINISLELCPADKAQTYLETDLDLEQVLLHFCVRDTGIGIKADELERLFEEFEQIDTGRTRRHEGAGLGLAISRRLAHLMQGDLKAESQSGKGSLFSLYLPVSYLQGESKPQEESSLQGKSLVGIDLTDADKRAFQSYCRDWGISFCSMTLQQWMAQDGTHPSPDHLLINGADPERTQQILDSFDPEKTGILTRPLPRRRITLLEPAERPIIAQMRECGITSYLVKPVRKASLLAGLLGEASAQSPLEEGFGGISTDKQPEPISEQTPARSSEQKQEKLHILLVEDNEINALLAKSILTKANMNVDLAISGQQALELYDNQQNKSYDVALLDLHMPDMDGLTLFDEMKQRDKLQGYEIAKIAFTADALQETRKTCLSHGFCDFIVKPVEPKSFVETVSRLAQRKGQNEEK